MNKKLNDKESIAVRIRLGLNIKTKRCMLKMNQKKLADMLGISVTSYSKIERGVSTVGFDRLMKICSILNLDLKSLENDKQKEIANNTALECLYRELRSLTEETKKFRNYLAGENCTIYFGEVGKRRTNKT
ncbi:MAG: helix-turn-helix domain-containing protein [Paludibacteraceae bacterium]|nr:helix-turn-helix domain-containing protein [Paludibacteraceae bacterium]